MARMLSLKLATQLAAAGVMWHPRPGDRFTITSEQLLGDLFWISELTIELHHYGGTSVLGFNGTTEWALDSVSVDQTLWLPREDQLRELLGDRLLSVHREPRCWRIVSRDAAGASVQTTDPDIECAYATALLHVA